MIKNYTQYIKEAENVDDVLKYETDESDSSKFMEIRDEIKSKIKKTSENLNKDYNSFIRDLLKNQKDLKIESLTKNSDLFEFYEKWRNDIDEILNDIKFFDKSPSQINSIGLYNYLIAGTQQAIIEVIKMK